MNKRIFLLVIPLLSLFIPLPTHTDEIYTWIDKNGIQHFVDSIDLVPLEYRKEAIKRAKTGDKLGTEGTYNILPREKSEMAPAHPISDKKGDEGEIPPEIKSPPPTKVDDRGKEYWQERIRICRETLEKAKKDLENAYNTRLFLITNTPPDFHEQYFGINQEIEMLKEKIKELERELNEVIPEEARKAGVPPGWLR